jgi:quaternary ammonium compound-resistance protein SugE
VRPATCACLAARCSRASTAYVVWVGIGAVGTAVLGVLIYREPITPMRALCVVLLVASIVGLKVTAPTADPP